MLTSFSPLSSSNGLGFMMLGGRGSVSHLINYGAIFRTAPTTQGLLITIHFAPKNPIYSEIGVFKMM